MLLTHVLVGNHNRLRSEPSEQWFRLKQIIQHPEYDSQDSFRNDLALLELNGMIEYTAEVQPLCLTRAGVEPGQLCATAGWGDTLGRDL